MINRAIILLVLITVVIAAIFGAIKYVSGLEADLQKSQENVSKLETGIETQKQAINNMQRDFSVITSINQEYTDRIRQQNQELRELQNKFTKSSSGADRDFGKVASEKPAIIEKIINKATAHARRCMELAMGDELTEQEKNESIKSLSNCAN